MRMQTSGKAWCVCGEGLTQGGVRGGGYSLFQGLGTASSDICSQGLLDNEAHLTLVMDETFFHLAGEAFVASLLFESAVRKALQTEARPPMQPLRRAYMLRLSAYSPLPWALQQLQSLPDLAAQNNYVFKQVVKRLSRGQTAGQVPSFNLRELCVALTIGICL